MNGPIEKIIKLHHSIEVVDRRAWRVGDKTLVSQNSDGTIDVANYSVNDPARLGLIAQCVLDAAEHLRQQAAAQIEADRERIPVPNRAD